MRGYKICGNLRKKIYNYHKDYRDERRVDSWNHCTWWFVIGWFKIATIPIATTATVPAAGLAGLLGLTTTATTIVSDPVTVPVAGILAVGALLTYGGYKAYNFVNNHP
ncbi:hypothetical protein QUA00_00135 [Microcoleus sp. T2B6]|uniref:hypothetical protein n=1 Tax=Microcoleus sp. T2B6 TaxID=3055424 RepID=UPI002FD645EA